MQVPSCIDRWKQDLLDTSGRNRALNYRKVQSTLELRLGETALLQRIAAGESITLAPPLLVSDNAPDRDSALVAALGRLRKLFDTQRTFQEEQGVHVLHAVVGWLEWPDQLKTPGQRDTVVTIGGKRAVLVCSPILFVPVQLARKKDDFTLTPAPDSDVEPNQALLQVLRTQYGWAPDFDLNQDGEVQPEEVLQGFQQYAEGKEHWRVTVGEPTSVIDTFSFKKIALYRELERSTDLVLAQPVLQALCGDAGALMASGDVVRYGNMDCEVPWDRLALAVPADSSQVQAIVTVLEGRHVVIQGPPGTGKSQTITNLVSTLVAAGKRVLFVAEKRAARDVVVGNLRKAHLGEVVLHITEDTAGSRSTAQSKSEILEQLKTLLEAGPQHFQQQPGCQAEFDAVRDQLNGYVVRLYQPLGQAPWSSPRQLVNRLSGCPEVLLPHALPAIPPVETVTDTWLASTLEAAAGLDELGEPYFVAFRGVWGALDPGTASATTSSAVLTGLRSLAGLPPALAAVATRHQAPDAPSIWTWQAAESLHHTLESLARFGTINRGLFRWVQPAYWQLKGTAADFTARGGKVTGDEAGSSAEVARFMAEGKAASALLRKVLRGFPEALAEQQRLALELLQAEGQLQMALAVRTALDNAPDAAATALLEGLVRAGHSAQPISAMTKFALYRQWTAAAILPAPELQVTAPSQQRRQERFREADARLQQDAVSKALNGFAGRRPSTATPADPKSPLGYLRGAISAKRRPALRRIFSQSAAAIQDLVPCIVSSPLGVAQFLSSKAYTFDVVIFDEASQIPVADAVVPISRAAQVVVVGDSQQMPPTSFFDRTTTTAGSDPEDDEEVRDFESILQQCESILPRVPLLWHYRSRDERLIAFSNHNFYDGKLLTFPAAWHERPDLGVQFEHCTGAVYGRGGSAANTDEARKVVELLRQELTSSPESAVAITALSTAQASVVQAAVEAEARQDGTVQQWLESGGRVKNLETIQGDECDVMILSFGYGRDAAGNFTANFGPLSRDNGYRRLNVAVTRARQKNVVVASIRAGDIPTTVASGGKYVRAYLDYAERGPIALLASASAPEAHTFESDFEEAVARRLQALGWQVDTQVGVSRFRIDLAVRDPRAPGRYLAGIECDGATYHSAQTARDRDLARQQVLERLGWTVLRVWSPEWFRQADQVVERLDVALRDLQTAEVNAPAAAVEPMPPSTMIPVVEPQARAAAPGSMPLGVAEYGLPEQYPDLRPHDDVRTRITRLVHDHGPLHHEELLTALRKHLGYGSLGRRIREELEHNLGQAERHSQIQQRQHWWWPPHLADHEVTVKRSNQDPKRKFEWHSDAELLRAADLIPAATRAPAVDDFHAQVARFLGYERVTEDMRARLREVLRYFEH